MKKFIGIIFCFLNLLIFSGCTGNDESYNKVFNYMESLSLLSCSDFYVKTENRVPRIFDEKGNSYTVTDNAVELSNTGIRQVLHADSDSFYYSTVQMAESYRSGNGYRIYRYYPKTGESKLIYSDVPVTNFDSILGLEDVFNISAPTSGHSAMFSTLFYIDGDTVIPYYKIKNIIAEAIEEEQVEIELSSVGFNFAVTNRKLIFADALGKLWIYSPKTRKTTPFCTQTVSHFFVTESKVFAFSAEKEEIIVFDVYGNEIKSLDIKGISFSRNSLKVQGNESFLKDENGRIWYIDENADMSITLFIATGNWCINGSKIILYDSKLEALDIESGLHKEHDFKAVKTKKPTCKKEGKNIYECICGNSYEEKIAKLPHTESEREYCTDEVICSVCKEVLEPMKEHEMNPVGIYNDDASCDKNGTETFTCQNCPYTETKETENTALGHEDTDVDNFCDRCNAGIETDEPVGFIGYFLGLFSKL